MTYINIIYVYTKRDTELGGTIYVVYFKFACETQ